MAESRRKSRTASKKRKTSPWAILFFIYIILLVLIVIFSYIYKINQKEVDLTTTVIDDGTIV